MLIIAHRGASHDAPENTLAAVRLAWEQGADAVEIDVHLTRDGRLAVIHDPDTQRTAGEARVIAEAGFADLRRLDVGRWKQPCFAGEGIPALEDVLALVPAGRRLFVEIKAGVAAVAALQRALAAAPPLRAAQLAVISFDLEVAAAAKRALRDREVCWIADSGAEAPRATLDDIIADARAAGLDGVDLEAGWPLDRARVQQIHALGFQVYVWTVDDAPVARRAAAAGVDGITTNRPGWLRDQLAAS